MTAIRRRLAVIAASAFVLSSLGATTSPAAAAECTATPAHQALCYVVGTGRQVINLVGCTIGTPPPEGPCPP